MFLPTTDRPTSTSEPPRAPRITAMHTASLSSKGQIVIPKALRNELNLLPGTRFALSVDAGRLVLEPLREPEFDLDAIHAAVDQLAGCLYRPEMAPTSAPEDAAAIVALLGAEDRRLGGEQP
jgi:AbrB family looped-hinge helix DNA binding protein